MGKQDRPDDHRARRREREASVVGSLSDMGLADLVQTLEMGRKSGVLHLKARTGTRGTCWLRDGRVVDCELTGAPAGEEAFYRILRWREGGFAIEFKPVEREERIALPTQALLLQGMRRIDEWGRLVEQLPPLDRPLEVDVARLGERLARLPDEVNTLLRMFDGRRTLAQVLEAAPRGDVATADDVARLVADGILRPPPDGVEPPADATPGAVPASPQAEPGGVDWFAGPVGAPAAAPVASWGPALAPAPAAPSQPDGAGWLEPPAAPASGAVADGGPRPPPRFSIPVPPPGSLPPPPTIAEILSRYQVVPRLLQPAAPPAAGAAATTEPQPLSSPGDAAPQAPAPPSPPAPDAAPARSSVGSLASPAATLVPEPPSVAAPAQPAPAPAASPPAAANVAPEAPRTETGARTVSRAPGDRSSPARPDAAASRPTSEPELSRRLRGESPARRRDLGSAPLQLDPPEDLLRERPPEAPRRSATPYAALGLVVLAVVVGGTALTRRPVLQPPAAATAAPAVPAADEPARVDAAAPAEPVAAPTARAERTPSAEAGPTAPGVSSTPAARPAAPAPPPATPPARKAAAPATAVADAPGPASPPVVPAASAGPDPRKLLAAADRKYAAGRYAEAIAGYRRVIALEPTPAVHVALARALYDAHRSAEAMQELDGVLSENPRDAGAWLMRGDIHQGEGRPAEAREAYQRFLELQPHGEQARTVRMILGREPR